MARFLVTAHVEIDVEVSDAILALHQDAEWVRDFGYHCAKCGATLPPPGPPREASSD